MSDPATITVTVTLACSREAAWDAFTTPSAIEAWNFASPTWHCPSAHNDLRTGGAFSYRMEARDGSMGFDYAGDYLEVVPPSHLRFTLGADREVLVEFTTTADGTRVSQTFTPDAEFPADQQRAGWQAIMDNYAAYVAGLSHTGQ